MSLINLPENKYNFLRFYPEANPTVDSSQYVEGLHNGYLYRWRSHADMLPVLTEDELVFYTNFTTDLIGSNSVKVLEGNTIINDVALYDITTTSFGDNNSKIELTIPSTNTKNNQVFSIGIVGSTGAPSFEENTKISGTSLINGTVNKVLKLSTGNFILVGDFSVTGETYTNVVVINSSGNKVNTYSFGTGFNNDVLDVAEQADGKLIFVGDFTSYNGTSINRIIRTSATGVYDSTFNVGTGADNLVRDVEIDSNGNVYIGSNSSFFYNGSGSSQRIFKLSTTATRDTGYVPATITPTTLKIQADDKLLVGRSGSNGIRRLNADGTTDGTFTSGLYSGAVVNTIELDGSGNIYVGGSSIYLSDPQKIAKLSSAGVLDTGFVTTITSSVLNLKREGSELYVAGSSVASIISLTGTDVETFSVSGNINNFVYVSNVFSLLTGTTSFSFDGGTSTSIALVEEVTNETILYRSNCFILKSRTEKNINNTHLLKFYNTSNIYGYEWENYDVNTSTPYTVRISSSIKDLSYEKDQTIYRSATSGVSRVTRATTSKTYQFETYYNNEDFHDAFSIVSSFRNFKINEKEYICEEYSIEYQNNLNIFKGVASLKDVEYGRRINVCSNLT